MSRWPLIFAAFAIGISVTVGERALYNLLTGGPLVLGFDVDRIRVALVAAPYIVLAIAGVRRLLPWAMGLVVTLATWGYFLYSTVSYSRHPDGSGADILGGLIMLASPLYISVVVLAANVLQERLSPHH